MCRAAAIFNNSAINILDKGKNYKLTPKDLDTELEKLEVGVERLACAMRYANTAWEHRKTTNNTTTNPIQHTTTPNNPPPQSNTIPQKRPLKEVTTFFDKHLKPPPIAIPGIEEKILKMKKHMEPLKKSIKSAKIPRNYRSI